LPSDTSKARAPPSGEGGRLDVELHGVELDLGEAVVDGRQGGSDAAPQPALVQVQRHVQLDVAHVAGAVAGVAGPVAGEGEGPVLL
jgi:hypothetical protein